MIRNYSDFLEALLSAGFSMTGGNSEGIYSIITWNWNEEPPPGSPIRWHTGDPETDPWEWINRVLDERDDIAYGKLFFKKSGYITKEWFPYFLAVRRGGISFGEAYDDGTISHFAKRIYEVVANNGQLPVEEIKRTAGFLREDKPGFDRAMTELQMKMFLSPCARRMKVSKDGTEYGWSSTVFCTTEGLFGEEVFNKAALISSEEAKRKITEQVLKINSSAQEKKITKFILGA